MTSTPTPELTSLTSLGPTPPRRLSLAAHEQLRSLILSGAIAPNTVLKQTDVARALGISRTPIREAFRMLQEEGLITGEPDQRAIVVGVDLADLDWAYATRILLEGFAAAVTADVVTARDILELERSLVLMRKHRSDHGSSLEWADAHASFHRLATAGAGQPLLKQLEIVANRTHHYLRLAQFINPGGWTGGENTHQAILAALRDRNGQEAALAMATHLASTARYVGSQAAPDQEMHAVHAAFTVISRGDATDSVAPMASVAATQTVVSRRPARRRSAANR